MPSNQTVLKFIVPHYIPELYQILTPCWGIPCLFFAEVHLNLKQCWGIPCLTLMKARKHGILPRKRTQIPKVCKKYNSKSAACSNNWLQFWHMGKISLQKLIFCQILIRKSHTLKIFFLEKLTLCANVFSKSETFKNTSIQNITRCNFFLENWGGKKIMIQSVTRCRLFNSKPENVVKFFTSQTDLQLVFSSSDGMITSPVNVNTNFL